MMPGARLRALVLSVTLVAGLALTGCSGGVGATGGKGYIDGDGQTIRIDPADRGKPVEMSGEGIDGKPIDVADFRGKPVVINVWGSWCVPCRKEMPLLVDIDKDLQGTATMMGINIREPSRDAALAFMKNKGGTWRSIHSPGGEALQSFRDSGQASPSTIPATVVLDAQGRVAALVSGEITKPGTFIRHVQEIADGG